MQEFLVLVMYISYSCVDTSSKIPIINKLSKQCELQYRLRGRDQMIHFEVVFYLYVVPFSITINVYQVHHPTMTETIFHDAYFCIDLCKVG